MHLGPNERLQKTCACLKCGEPLEITAEVIRPGKPPPLFTVVVTMCILCGHVMAFNGDDLRELTSDEAGRVDRDERIEALRDARKKLLM